MTVEEVVGKVLHIEPSKITDETSPENTEQWDSFNGLMLAVELEKTYNVSFSMDEIVSTRNVGDIKKNLGKHKVPLYS